MLENNNIRLRALEPEDIEFLYVWENDTSIWNVGDTVSPLSRHILRSHIANAGISIYETKQMRLIAESKSTGNALGIIDLYDFDFHHRKAAVGILISTSSRRRGVGREALNMLAEYAFSYLKLHQLYAYIPAGNNASLALFRSCGFEATIVLREWISTTNGFEDIVVAQKINQSDEQNKKRKSWKAWMGLGFGKK